MTFLGKIFGSDGQADSVVRTDPPVTASNDAVPFDAKPGIIAETFGGSGHSRVKTLPPVTPDIAQRHATVFACCNVIAGDLSKVPLRVVQEDKATGRMVPVREHSLDYLLNVEGSYGVPSMGMRLSLDYSFCLRGTGYAFAPRDGAGQPLLIEYVHTDRCSVYRDGRARFYDFEDGAGVQRRAPARSMVHMRYLAQDGWTGRSPLTVAAESVGLALAGQESAARTASGTQLRGYAVVEDNFESIEDRDLSHKRIRASMNDPMNNGIPILGTGDSIESLDLTAADQELLGSRKFDREQIAAIYRVPPSKLQMLEFGVKANGQQQAIDYRTDCLLHWGSMIGNFMALGLLTRSERERGLHLVHNYDALMQATTKERYEAKAKAIGGPWMTVNYGRAEEGMEPIAGGDVLYPPPNMTKDASDDDGKKGDDSDDE